MNFNNIRIPNILRAVFLSVCLFGSIRAFSAGKANSITVSISSNASAWNFLYGIGMPAHPTQLGAGWFFDFPHIIDGEVDYLTQEVKGSLPLNKTMIADFFIEATAGTIFDHYTEPSNTSDFPAHVRFYIQKSPRLSNKSYDRWWSNPLAVKLENMTSATTLAVPLTPDQWTDTYGARGSDSKAATDGFNAALQNVSQIGVTFGGGYFFGHGVRVENGTATFTCTRFTVQ